MKRAMIGIYNRLLEQHGKQNWWPVTPQGELLPEYSGGPKDDRQRLEVAVGAILTQNTSWKNVSKAIQKLYERELMDLEGLTNVEQEELAEVIRSSGYYREKAKKLKNLGRFLFKNPFCDMLRAPTAKLRGALLSINGVGPETADSILLYALGKPSFVVDAYALRIFTRLGLFAEGSKVSTGKKYLQIQGVFHAQLERRASLFNEYHALIVAHGKDVCKKRPFCGDCALGGLCPKSSRLPESSQLY